MSQPLGSIFSLQWGDFVLRLSVNFGIKNSLCYHPEKASSK